MSNLSIEDTIIGHYKDMDFLEKWVRDPSTPLEAINACVVYDYINLVKILLDRGADPNSVKDDHFIYESGDTLLQVAVHHNNFEMVKLLLEHGANPNHHGLFEETLLFHTIHPEITQILIDKVSILIIKMAKVIRLFM